MENMEENGLRFEDEKEEEIGRDEEKNYRWGRIEKVVIEV